MKATPCQKCGILVRPGSDCRCTEVPDPDYFYMVRWAIYSIPKGIKNRHMYLIFGQLFSFLLDTYLITHSWKMVLVNVAVNTVFLAYFLNPQKRKSYKWQLAFISLEWGFFLTGGMYGLKHSFLQVLTSFIVWALLGAWLNNLANKRYWKRIELSYS